MPAVSREGPRLRADFRGRGRRAADLSQDHRLFAGQGKKLTTPFGSPATAIRHLACLRGRPAEPTLAASDPRVPDVSPTSSESALWIDPLYGAPKCRDRTLRRHTACAIPLSSPVSRRLCRAANCSMDFCRAFRPAARMPLGIRPGPIARRRRCRLSRKTRGSIFHSAPREIPQSRLSMFSTSCRRHCPRSRYIRVTPTPNVDPADR